MSNEVETPRTIVAALKDLIAERHAEIARVVPSHVNAERLTKMMLMSVARSPRLARCAPESIFVAFVQAATYGLEIGGANREGQFEGQQGCDSAQ